MLYTIFLRLISDEECVGVVEDEVVVKSWQQPGEQWTTTQCTSTTAKIHVTQGNKVNVNTKHFGYISV